MSTYTGSALTTKYAAYLIYKGTTTAAVLNTMSSPKIGFVYDITEGGTLTDGNIVVVAGDAVCYMQNGWRHMNNAGADALIAELQQQFEELLEEIGETDFSKFALKTEIPDVPTDISAFNNDAGYLTQHQSLENYALKTEIPDVSNFATFDQVPTKVSELENDARYLTQAMVDDRVRKVADFEIDENKTDGEIIQYNGPTTAAYTNGYFYKYTVTEESYTVAHINTQPETTVANTDPILSKTNGAIAATIGMDYNSTNQHLELKGNGGAVVAYVNMAAFIKDGMLDNVEKYTTAEQGVDVPTPYFKFTFNTDSGKSVIRISLSDLIDVYDGSNVNLTSAFIKAATYSAPATGDSVDIAIGKLLKGHEDNVTAIAEKQATITGAATSITDDDLTATRALVSDASGKVAVSDTTSTELGYVHGVTSNIQTQINAKQNALTYDAVPTASSTNPVISDGIKSAIDSATTALGNSTIRIIADKDNTPIADLVSGGVYFNRQNGKIYGCTISGSTVRWTPINNSSSVVFSDNMLNHLSVASDKVVIGNADTTVTNAAFLVGNGIETPHNAMVVDWNGNLTASGNITDGQGNTLADLPTKATLGDVLVDGKVILWDATNQCLVTATTDQLRNLLMWIGTETELRTLQQNDTLEEGKLYATLDNTYFS